MGGLQDALSLDSECAVSTRRGGMAASTTIGSFAPVCVTNPLSEELLSPC